jgi:hypothetical protein
LLRNLINCYFVSLFCHNLVHPLDHALKPVNVTVVALDGLIKGANGRDDLLVEIFQIVVSAIPHQILSHLLHFLPVRFRLHLDAQVLHMHVKLVKKKIMGAGELIIELRSFICLRLDLIVLIPGDKTSALLYYELIELLQHLSPGNVLLSDFLDPALETLDLSSYAKLVFDNVSLACHLRHLLFHFKESLLLDTGINLEINIVLGGLLFN